MTKTYKRNLIAMAKQYGAEVDFHRSGHPQIRHPSGWSVPVSCTPRDETDACNQIRQMLKRRSQPKAT